MRALIAAFLLASAPSAARAESIEISLADLGGKAWSGFKCVRFADEASGSVDAPSDRLFQQALIAARAFLSAHEAGLISGEAMVASFQADERRFLFGPSVEFKVGAMVTLATEEADRILASASEARDGAASEAWSASNCGELH